MRILLYALTPPARQSPRIRGVRGEPLRVVSVHRLSALVGVMKTVPRVNPRTLRAYHAVMAEIAKRHAAMLPARFGALLDDEEELAFVLRSREASFLRLLRHVRGRVQMTVRIVGVTDVPQSASRLESPRRSGTAYLRARASAQRSLGELAVCRAVRAAVGRWVRDERLERQNEVVTMYHLVPRSATARYRRALGGLTAAADARVHVTGPFPPFAFADPFGLEAPTVAQPVTPAGSSSTRHG